MCVCVCVLVCVGVCVQDWIGLLRPRHYPTPNTPSAAGTHLSCRVLDVTRVDGIVDLSARKDLLAAPTTATTPQQKGQIKPTNDTNEPPGKKRKKGAAGSDGTAEAGSAAGAAGAAASAPAGLPDALKLGETVTATVELIRDAPAHVAVLSVPAGGADGGRVLVYAALTDYNAAVPAGVKRRVEIGGSVPVTLQVRVA